MCSKGLKTRGEVKNPNTPITLRLQSKNVSGERTLDADGRAEIAALPPGQYEVILAKGKR